MSKEHTYIDIKPRHIPGISYPVYAMVLVMGSWREELPARQYRLMIAEALNYCVQMEDVHIRGYMITARRLFLVLKIEREQIDHVLDTFSTRLKVDIRQYKNLGKSLEQNRQGERVVPMTIEMITDLFTPYALLDDQLIQLLMGRRFRKPYDDPALARMEKIVYNNDFCSVISYSGGKGPVIIKRLKY